MVKGIDIYSRIVELGDALFPVKYSDYLTNRNIKLHGLRLVTERNKMELMFGSLTPTELEIVNRQPPKLKSAYGCNASIGFEELNIQDDLFILSSEFGTSEWPTVSVLIVHELCHWYIDSKLSMEKPIQVSDNASKLAHELYTCVLPSPGLREFHDLSFCRLYCAVCERAQKTFGLPGLKKLIRQGMKFDTSKEKINNSKLLS